MRTASSIRATAFSAVTAAALLGWAATAFADGTLRIGREQDSTTLDPILTIQNVDIWVMDNMNAGLVRVTYDGNGLEPDLAEKWMISDDALTYTFTLRDGIKFSDGSAVTPQDVKFSLERLRDQKDSVMGSMYKVVKSVDTPDAKTVVITLTEPSAPFLSTLAMFSASIVPQKAVAERGADFGSNPVGAGAFMLKEWKRGDTVSLVRNPNYWEAARVKLDGVDWLNIPNDNTRVLKLQGGELEAAVFIPFNQIDTLAKDPNINIHLDPSSREDSLVVNHAHKPLDDVRVRKAVCMAIDRDTIVKTVLFGHGQAANSFIPGGALYYSAANKVCGYDPGAATKLLTNAGAKDVALKLLIVAGNSIDDQTAVLIKDQLGKIGITADIEKQEGGTQFQSLIDGQYDLAINYWTNDIIDPDEKVTFTVYGIDDNRSYYTNYKNEKVTKLVEEGRHEMNADKRRAIYAEIQQIVADDVHWIDLYYSPFRNASRKTVQKFYQNPTGRFMLEDTSIQ